MKKTANIITIIGCIMILNAAGLSDAAADFSHVAGFLFGGALMIVIGRCFSYAVDIYNYDKKVRRNRQWRRIETRERSCSIF